MMRGLFSGFGSGQAGPPNNRGDSSSSQGNLSRDNENNQAATGNAPKNSDADDNQGDSFGLSSGSRRTGANRSDHQERSGDNLGEMRGSRRQNNISTPSQFFSETTSRRRTSQMPNIFGIGRSANSSAEHELERRISTSARELCEGVHTIVQEAKMNNRGGSAGQDRSPDEWKRKLLELLGGSDQDIEERLNRGRSALPSHVDELLECSSCEKFVLRCVENELPPNLIHCLRLLRMLELQHAHARGSNLTTEGPVSTTATAKVSRLLCLLCTDPSVEEQLRPHLFGLLALSGAKYPATGVHVAEGASAVILEFCNSCLSNSLVWFLHDRKMIIHMTDDTKELCGMTSISSSSATKCLHGQDAEKAGLWVIALKTLVSLVTYSCQYDCTKLIQDFDLAGGYHVLSYAIANSDESNVKKLLELVTMLVCCRVNEDSTMEDLASDAKKEGLDAMDALLDESRLATNVSAFEIVEDLMIRSIPFLHVYQQAHHGQRPVIEIDNLNTLAEFSVQTARKVISSSDANAKPPGGFNLAYELLVTTLQLFSDHSSNISIIESKYNILSYFLLSFPTFADLNIKVLILKVLEYICTGMTRESGSQVTLIPISVASEIFLSMCTYLMQSSSKMISAPPKDPKKSEQDKKIFDSLLLDTEMLCGTIEKLVEFDEITPKVMQDCGLMDDQVNEMLTLVTSIKTVTVSEDEKTDGPISPPVETIMDGPFSAVCRVLKMVATEDNEQSNIPGQGSNSMNLNVLLMTAVKKLGDNASKNALSVFEAIMGQMHMKNTLENALSSLIDMLHHFADGVELRMSNGAGSGEEYINGVKTSLDNQSIRRELQILDVIKMVLETNDLAQELFPLSGGYQVMLRLLWSLEGAIQSVNDGNKDMKKNDDKQPLLDLIKTCYAIVSSSSTFSVTKKMNTSSISTATETIDGSENQTTSLSTIIDSSSTTLSPNRSFLLRSGFYIEFSSAVAATGILNSPSCSLTIVNLSLSTMESHLSISIAQPTPSSADLTSPSKIPTPPTVRTIQNSDASLIVLGIAVLLPSTQTDIAKRGLDEILRLCAPAHTGSTLSQIARSGLTRSLTSPSIFGTQLEDRTHPLYSRFVLLLRRVTAFHMSYVDFVSLLRCIAGPILRQTTSKALTAAQSSSSQRVSLPVISSFISSEKKEKNKNKTPGAVLRTSVPNQTLDTDICARLETLAIIAARGDRVGRCLMGDAHLGESEWVWKESIPIDDRLFRMADETSLKFIHLNCIDSGAAAAANQNFPSGGHHLTSPTGSSGGVAANADKVWPPFVNCGFSYSCWIRLPTDGSASEGGLVFLLDLSTRMNSSHGHNQTAEFFSVWYELSLQQFHVLTSSTSRLEPVRFPRSPLQTGVWHHLLLTYVPPKRPMLSRKAMVALYIDGRPLEAEVKVENVNLPPTAVGHVGVPNPYLASSVNQVASILPRWELGPIILISTVLTGKEATAMFSAGPDFEGLFWGDRPQRLSLTATATAAFAMLAESGEKGSVAGALRRRNVPVVEAAGHVTREKGSQEDTLTSVGLLCNIDPQDVVFGFRAGASVAEDRENGRTRRRLVNVARIDTHENLSSDAFVYGKESVITPNSFSDNIQWIGGPNVLMPLVNAVQTASSLAITLRLIHNSVKRHPPNLENLQGGGGYRILGLLLRQKQIMDSSVMDQCFAFAVHGFEPGSDFARRGDGSVTDHWVLTDLDAMKYLLLNHQVWDMRRNGPDLPLRVLQFLNNLVAANSVHAAFNSRRLHLLGIVRWTLHLMLEAAELYDARYDCASDGQERSSLLAPSGGNHYDRMNPMNRDTSPKQYPGQGPGKRTSDTAWRAAAPSVAGTAVGGDPGNPLLRGCKSLLRRVLTYMLTPDDLEALAGVIIYTLSITGSTDKGDMAHYQPNPAMMTTPNNHHNVSPTSGGPEDEKLAPGPVARIYLLRLLEELVVDGVNEIVSANAKKPPAPPTSAPVDGDTPAETAMQPHAGGGTSANQYYFATSILARKKNPRENKTSEKDVTQHPKHQQAQAFLSAFAGILTPVWFACVLEGSREEASASAALRLMMLMLQSSPTFGAAFEMAGGFSPLVLSIPKFSTCPAIILSMLSQLLHAPILHLPCFATLDAAQLCEVFDLESDATELIINDSTQGGLHTPSDPSCGIFALLAECLGRNIQLASYRNDMGFKARHTNEAVIRLLGHRHTFSSSFQEFCRTPDFLEPLAQALCLVHDQKMQRMIMFQSQEGNPSSVPTPSSNYEPPPPSNYGGFGQQSEDTDFLPWGGQGGASLPGQNPYDDGSSPYSSRDPRARQKTKRRGSLAEVNRDETPTERFIGKGTENATSGIGMVELLHLVLSHAVKSGPTAATLLAALFRSFPIHASLEQVEAFHLVLIEHCKNVVEDALQRGEPIALANCIGVSSVLLDRLMAGFFTSEPVLETVNIILATLRSLTATGTYASRTLANADQTMLVADTAHFARLTCLTALHRSRPSGPYDEGDDDLKLMVLEAIAKNLRQLLLIPGGGTPGKKQNSAPSFVPPQPGNRFFPLYQSASLTRCSPPGVTAIYPELFQLNQPDRSFVVSLMSQIYHLLLDRRRDIREQAVVIVVSLLQQRREFMQELLITDIPRGENRIETVDLMNRGGFGALMVAHEAASLADDDKSNASSSMGGAGLVPSGMSGSMISGMKMSGSSMSRGPGIGKLKYQSFFEWFNRNQPQIAAVFHGIHIQASRLLPGVGGGASTPEEAIENEQKVMLLKLTSQDSSDRTIQGGIKRAELAESLHEKTSENHALWKRQGFDDLSSGAMLWKLLLRHLKGTHSIWEGGYNKEKDDDKNEGFPRKQLKGLKMAGEVQDDSIHGTDLTKDKKVTPMDKTKTRWKLDLTEGYERQRRRLLPNHEFQALYNLNKISQIEEEKNDDSSPNDKSDADGLDADSGDRRAQSEHWKQLQSSWRRGGMAGGVDALETTEITAALVREMQMRVGAKDRDFDDDDDNEEQGEDMMEEDNVDELGQRGDAYGEDMEMLNGENQPLEGNQSSSQLDGRGGDTGGGNDGEDEKSDEEDDDERDNSLASSYDLITGLLEPGDWPEKSYNVKRCAGLEVRRALLLWCREAIYIVDGFEQTEGDGLEGKINRLQMSTSTYDINLREDDMNEGSRNNLRMADAHRDNSPHEGAGSDQRAKEATSQIAGDEITYQHRSQRIAFSDIYSVYRRRYQLQQIALEFYDVNRYGTLVSFSSEEEREEVLFKVLNSPLPNSIFSSSMSGSVTINYNKFMNSLRAKITNQWVNGRMSNFEYIMQLNSFAGRTYNDLTQYPVFPWIVADYESEELDLNDPNTYRDLSKPMGAQTEARAMQYRERFEVLEASAQMNPDEPPPFHYGTHYSCAAYVLYYLMRLEPFSRMALSLQGGHFDHADRLFHNVGSSWLSASAENLQDVRELIPEFFYLGEFLVNSDNFDFGTTQGGKVVHDVTLPPWAKGDPARFIRMNRQALESDYVSKNLHNWLDLVFGYKQKGREADKALNKFVHLTYEGNVDLNDITDPIQREATIAQIHNFGQTPSKLERKPFPQRNVFAVAKEKAIDFSALFFLAALTPPFCVVGAPHRVYLRVSSIDTCRVGMEGQPDSSVGDMYWFKGQLVGVGRTCALILPSKKYYRFGGANNGVSVHVAIPSAKYRVVNQVLTIHDGMHRSPISIAKPSLNGEWLVTGCIDSTVRVWRYNGKNVILKASLCGHEGGKITCIDVSTTFGNVVTGGEDGNVLLWDLRRLTFLRQLKHEHNEYASSKNSLQYDSQDKGVISVSINHKNGNILTLVGFTLNMFDINGNLLATQDASTYKNLNRPSCAIATSCPEWMENGVVAVTGHINGDVRLWSLNYDTCFLVMRHLVPDKVHSCPITSLRVYGEMQDTLLVGDRSGKMSVCKTLRLDGLNQQELNLILKEIQSGAGASPSSNANDMHYEDGPAAQAGGRNYEGDRG